MVVPYCTNVEAGLFQVPYLVKLHRFAQQLQLCVKAKLHD